MKINSVLNLMFVHTGYDELENIECPECGEPAIAWGYELQVKTSKVSVCRKDGAEYIHYED